MFMAHKHTPALAPVNRPAGYDFRPMRPLSFGEFPACGIAPRIGLITDNRGNAMNTRLAKLLPLLLAVLMLSACGGGDGGGDSAPPISTGGGGDPAPPPSTQPSLANTVMFYVATSSSSSQYFPEYDITLDAGTQHIIRYVPGQNRAEVLLRNYSPSYAPSRVVPYTVDDRYFVRTESRGLEYGGDHKMDEYDPL